MKRKMKEIWTFLKAFLAGLKIGFDWWDIVLFKEKLPKVVVLMIVIVCLPFNLLIILVGALMGELKLLHSAVEDIIIEVEFEKRSRN